MARARGPRLKIVRRFGQHLPGLTRKSAENRPYPPGQHGQSRKPKASDYRVRLDEKQKLRLNYGLSERQLRTYFKRASRIGTDTGQELLIMLESRLDNVLFRAGLAPTIPAARQMVTHGHIRVNGKKTNIPSYVLKAGQQITVKDKIKNNEVVKTQYQSPTLEIPSYIERTDDMNISFAQRPTREDIPVEIQEHLIVEHYSRIA